MIARLSAWIAARARMVPNRLRAERTDCVFVDRVNHREVWRWRTPEGRVWLGQSRFGLWVER